MEILERNTLNYLTPRPFCPRHAKEFILNANAAERALLAEWCEKHGVQFFVKAGISWGRDYIIKAIAPTQSLSDRFQAFVAQYSAPKRQPDQGAEKPADPLAAWVVAELSERAKISRAA